MRTSSFGWCVRITRRSGRPSGCPPGPEKSSNATSRLTLPERWDAAAPLQVLPCCNPRLVTAFPPADQHRSQDQRPDQAQREHTHAALLRGRPEDGLQPDGERLVPALPEVRHLPRSAGLHLKVADVKRANLSSGGVAGVTAAPFRDSRNEKRRNRLHGEECWGLSARRARK